MKNTLLYLTLLFTACTRQPPIAPVVTTRSVIFTNPIVEAGADPWIIQQDSLYHYCYSGGGNSIYIRSSSDVTKIAAAEPRQIWIAPENTSYSQEIWAPELHFLDGKWYVYFAADDGDNAHHRMHVLVSEDDQVTGKFTYHGKISSADDKWAIDGTVLQHQEKMYFIWSGWEGDQNGRQDLYIAAMDTPLSISSARTLISQPEYEWEKKGSGEDLPTINEGPQVLQHQGKTYVLFSASGSWSDDYCLGMLQLTGDDPLDPTAWVKSPEPVFSGTDCVISPGHASFIEIQGQSWIVYHATRFKGGGWKNRYVKMQPFYWTDAGPNFGKPVADGVLLKIDYSEIF